MGFGQNFCRNMAKRSYQYAVRSTYDLFKPAKSSNYIPSSYFYEQEKEERQRQEKKGYDKNGWPYNWQRHKKAIFQGKEYDIVEVDGKMITLSDGKRHRLSSCILVDKFAGGKY